jgi:uncharacterized protein
MILRLTDLPEEGLLHLRTPLDPADLALPVDDGAVWDPVSLDLTAQKIGDECLVQGRLRTRLLHPCARCLEPLPLEIDIPFHECYPLGKQPGIDLTPALREYILLELPIAFRCNLDAEGRCPVTGRIHQPGPDAFTELKRKEVWEALEQLKPKQ